MPFYFFCGCQKQEKKDFSLKINCGVEPTTLSCQLATTIPTLEIIYHIGEGLVRINPHGVVEPALAEKIEVYDNGLRYRFTLRENIEWDLGLKVTPYDFERSYRQILSKQAPAPMGDLLFVIKNGRKIFDGHAPIEDLGLKIINDRVFEIELEAYNPAFLQLLSMPIFYPIPENYTPDTPSKISCGAYYLASWKKQEKVVLQKNPNYWNKDNIHIEEIIFSMIRDPHTQLAIFNEGNFDFCGSPFLALPDDAIDELEAKKQIFWFVEPTTYMLSLNTQKGIFQNQKMRKAFSLAVDRASLIRHRIFTGSTATAFVPPDFAGEKNSYFPEYDPKLALKLFEQALAETGYTRENFPPIRFAFSHLSPSPRRAQALQGMWRKVLGVEVNLSALESLRPVQISGDFDISLASWVGDYQDPINFLQLYQYRHGPKNFPRWENEEYIEALNCAMSLSSLEERKPYYKKAESILMDEMPIAPLTFPKSPYICSKRLKNIYCNPIGYVDFHWAHLE